MTGYPRKTRRASAAAVVFMMSMHCVQTRAEDTGLPAMEMLEFLADWEMDDGRWVDPVELDEVQVAPADDTEERDAAVTHE